MCAECATPKACKPAEVRALEALETRRRATLAIAMRARAGPEPRRESKSSAPKPPSVAFAVARKKIAPAALAALPAGDVEAALRDAMHQAIGEPRITLRTAPAVAEAIAPRIARDRP